MIKSGISVGKFCCLNINLLYTLLPGYFDHIDSTSNKAMLSEIVELTADKDWIIKAIRN